LPGGGGGKVLKIKDELVAIIDRHAFAPKQETPIAGLSIFKVEAPTLPVESIYTPRLCVVLQGRKEISLGGRTFEVDETQYFIASVNLPVSARITVASRNCAHYAVSFELDGQALAEMLPHVSTRPPSSHREGLSLGKQTEDILSALHRVMALVDRPEDLGALLAPAATELYYRLLQGEHGATLRDFATGNTKLAQIGRVTSWLKEHYREPMSIGLLASLAGMSPTSLHRHFKATTLMTPLEYRMHVRLHEARKLLLIGGSDARGVGFAVGYESQTQFTREYRRLFGRPPLQDVRLLKGKSPSRPTIDEGKAILKPM